MTHENDLPRLIEQFLKETGMGPTYFGRRAVGVSEFVPRIRRALAAGKTPRITVEKDRQARDFMESYRQSAAATE